MPRVFWLNEEYLQAMSQAKPREFKFVDGRARKRRKRGAAQAVIPGVNTTSLVPTSAVSHFSVVREGNTNRRSNREKHQQHQGIRIPQTTDISSSLNNSQSSQVTDPDLAIDPRLLVPQELNELISWPPQPDINSFYLGDAFDFSEQPTTDPTRTRQAEDSEPALPSIEQPTLEQTDTYARAGLGPDTSNENDDHISTGDGRGSDQGFRATYSLSPRHSNLTDSLTSLLG